MSSSEGRSNVLELGFANSLAIEIEFRCSLKISESVIGDIDEGRKRVPDLYCWWKECVGVSNVNIVFSYKKSVLTWSRKAA